MDWIGTFFYVFKVSIFLIGMGFAIRWHYERDLNGAVGEANLRSPSELRLFMAMIAVCGVSFLGVVYAACSGEYSEGGNGGAIGCASLFTLSLMSLLSKPRVEMVPNSDHGQASQEQLNSLPEPNPATLIEGSDQLAGLKSQTERLRAALVARLASAEREKVYLGVAGFISALAWKFGDIPAAWLDFRH